MNLFVIIMLDAKKKSMIRPGPAYAALNTRTGLVPLLETS